MLDKKEYAIALSQDSFDEAVEIFNEYLEDMCFLKFLIALEESSIEEKYLIISEFYRVFGLASIEKSDTEDFTVSVVFDASTYDMVVSYNK